MDIKDTFFQRIVYKKNAYEDLKSFLKFYHSGKNMLILHSEDGEVFDKFLISIAESKNPYSILKVNKYDKFSFQEMNRKINEYSLIIAFGDDKICNLVKALSNNNNCEYILCPSGYSFQNFSCYYFEPYIQNIYKKGFFPTKIYIDEYTIKNCDLNDIGNGLKLLLSFYEVFFTLYMEKEISNFYFNYDDIEKCLNRFEEIFMQLSQNNDDAKLSLMDNFIEISYNIKSLSFNQFSSYNLAYLMQKLDVVPDYNFEDYILISSDILLTIYKECLSSKTIKQVYQPDFYEISKIIERYNFNIELYKKLEFYNSLIKNKELFMKINSIKVKAYLRLEKIIKEFKDNIKKINIFSPSSTEVLNYNNVYKAINVLPFIYQNNMIVDIMAGVGMLSF